MFAWTMIVAALMLAIKQATNAKLVSQASEPGTGAASQGDYCCIRKDRSSSCLTLTMLSFERRRRRVELGPKALSRSRHSRSSSTPWKGKEDARLLLTRLNMHAGNFAADVVEIFG